MPLELSEQDLVILERVKKLLAIANDARGNENQASVAAAKAHELLEKYNLDMAMVGKTAKGKQRGYNNFKGGLYKWQRYLWEAVAHLNFCLYWSRKGNRRGATYEHRILGRQHNVIGAQVLADYLQQTVERLAQDMARERGLNVFCKEMIAYREGMATRLCRRLNELRRQRLEEERHKQEEQASKSTGTNLVSLSGLIQDEKDLNLDFVYGCEPGTHARRRHEYAVEQRQRQEEFEKWKVENPEEYAKLQEQRRKEDEEWRKREERNARRRKGTYRERAKTSEELRAEMPEFREGYDRGGDISLNQQVKDSDNRKVLP